MKKNLKIGLGIFFSIAFLLIFFSLGWNWGWEDGWDSAREWNEWKDEWWLSYLVNSTGYNYNNVLNRCMNYVCEELDPDYYCLGNDREVTKSQCEEIIWYNPKFNYTEYLYNYNPEIDPPLT